MSCEVTVRISSDLFTSRDMRKTVTFETTHEAMALVLDVLQAVELRAGRDPDEVMSKLSGLRASIEAYRQADALFGKERGHD